MTERKLHFVVAGIASLTLAAGLAAQPQPKLERGTHELAVHVSPDFEGAVGDMLFARVGYGFLVRNRLALGANFDYAILEDVAGEDSDYRTSEWGVAATYHLGLGGRAVAYLGVGVGWRSTHFGDLEASALAYGPRAGVALFLADNVALDFEIVYRTSSDNVFVNDFLAEDSDLSSAIGLRFFF
jgi:opacity protein-like surface antigen